MQLRSQPNCIKAKLIELIIDTKVTLATYVIVRIFTPPTFIASIIISKKNKLRASPQIKSQSKEFAK